MTEFSQKIINQIQTDRIKPKSRFHFWWQRLMVWLLLLLLVTIASLASGVIIFLNANQDWDIYSKITNNFSIFIILSLPYFWLIIFATLLIFGYYNFRHTKRGYRYSLLSIALVYLATTFSLGLLFYYLGWGNIIESKLAQNLPIYNRLVLNRSIWLRPDQGLLAGKIIGIQKYTVIIQDLSGHNWGVDTSSTTGRGLISLGQDIKIIGRQIDADNFIASEIRNWCGCSGCARHQGQSCIDHCKALK